MVVSSANFFIWYASRWSFSVRLFKHLWALDFSHWQPYYWSNDQTMIWYTETIVAPLMPQWKAGYFETAEDTTYSCHFWLLSWPNNPWVQYSTWETQHHPHSNTSQLYRQAPSTNLWRMSLREDFTNGMLKKSALENCSSSRSMGVLASAHTGGWRQYLGG